MNIPTIAVIHGRKNKNKDNDPYLVEVRLTVNRKARYISTGVKVRAAEWRNGYVVNRRDAVELNERISVIRRAVEQRVNAAIANNTILDVTTLGLINNNSNSSNSFLDFVSDRAAKRPVRESTRERYRVFISKMYEYGKVKTFADVTVANIKDFDEWLHGRGICQATVYNYHKAFKLFINEAVALDKMMVNPYTKLRAKIGRGGKEVIEYLNEDEMQKVRSAKMNSSFTEHARDLFVFQMYTGLGYSDMAQFDLSAYDLENGRYVKNDTRVKTGVRYINQLLPPAIEVLKKYDGKLPIMCNADYNKALKIVQVLAGITKNMHSHLARSTFATFMLSNGCSVQNVSRMLGHTNLKQTMKYAEILEKDVRSDFDMIADKLKEKS